MGHVQIDEVHTDLVITDSMGPLSPEDLKKLLKYVMEHIRSMNEHAERKRDDDGVQDRNYYPDVDEGHSS
jgi:hypothetical protein